MQRYSQPTASPLELRTQNKKTNIVSIWVRKQHPRTRNEECFGIRETPKSIRLHLNGILFRSKNAVLVHFGTHTTQHYTTRESPPQGSPPPGNRRRRPFACGGRSLPLFCGTKCLSSPSGCRRKSLPLQRNRAECRFFSRYSLRLVSLSYLCSPKKK